MRPKRKRQLTPKNEAQKGLNHAKHLLGELEKLTEPKQKELFVNRFNDFLRSARTVVYYLGSESGRPSEMKTWVKQEHKKLRRHDKCYDHFVKLRNVSEKDCIVEPDVGRVSIEVVEQMKMRGSMEAELRDATTGKVTARISSSAPHYAETVIESTTASTKYFLADWPNEDLMSFCRKVVRTLEVFVSRAYELYP